MDKTQKLKIWLTLEFVTVVCFYYVAYSIIPVILGNAKPWIETSIEFQTFCVTWTFLYATFSLVNFIMSWVKGKDNAFSDCFTGDWFSVHKLFKKQREA